MEYLPKVRDGSGPISSMKADYLVIAVENPFAEKYLGMEKRRRARIWQQDPSGDRKDVWRKLQCEDRQRKRYGKAVILDAAGNRCERERGNA